MPRTSDQVAFRPSPKSKNRWGVHGLRWVVVMLASGALLACVPIYNRNVARDFFVATGWSRDGSSAALVGQVQVKRTVWTASPDGPGPFNREDLLGTDLLVGDHRQRLRGMPTELLGWIERAVFDETSDSFIVGVDGCRRVHLDGAMEVCDGEAKRALSVGSLAQSLGCSRSVRVTGPEESGEVVACLQLGNGPKFEPEASLWLNSRKGKATLIAEVPLAEAWEEDSWLEGRRRLYSADGQGLTWSRDGRLYWCPGFGAAGMLFDTDFTLLSEDWPCLVHASWSPDSSQILGVRRWKLETWIVNGVDIQIR